MKGKEWTKEQREQIVQSLKPYLEMGFSRNKACEFVGLAPATLSNWIKEEESLGILITSFENVVNTIAMNNIVDAIRRESELEEDIRKENSWKWAERRMKEDFSLKTENQVDQKTTVSLSFDESFNDTPQSTEKHSEESSQI
jgi:transposase-like protein